MTDEQRKQFMAELKELCKKHGMTMGGGGDLHRLIVSFRGKTGGN